MDIQTKARDPNIFITRVACWWISVSTSGACSRLTRQARHARRTVTAARLAAEQAVAIRPDGRGEFLEAVALATQALLAPVLAAAALDFKAPSLRFTLALWLFADPAPAPVLAHGFAAAISDAGLMKAVALFDAVHA